MGHDLPSIATACTKASRQKVGRTEKKEKEKQKRRRKRGSEGELLSPNDSRHPLCRSLVFRPFVVRYLSVSLEKVFKRLNRGLMLRTNTTCKGNVRIYGPELTTLFSEVCFFCSDAFLRQKLSSANRFLSILKLLLNISDGYLLRFG